MKVWHIRAKPPRRAAHPTLEIIPSQNDGRWAVYLCTSKARRFYEWADDARLQELLDRHRESRDTVELVEKEPRARWR